MLSYFLVEYCVCKFWFEFVFWVWLGECIWGIFGNVILSLKLKLGGSEGVLTTEAFTFT